VKRNNDQKITNSKDIRKLRQVLKDPVAKEHFLSAEGTIENALGTLSPAPSKKGQGLLGDIEQLSESLRQYPWTTLNTLRGDQEVLRKLEEAEKLIKELKKNLSR
jgi:ParB family chromosome partitioning protein